MRHGPRSFLSSAVVVGLLLTGAWAGVARAYEQQVREVARELAGKIRAAGAQNVAVVDFTDLRGEVNELGRFLAEELSVALAEEAEGFRVIDRTRLAVVMKEQKLSTTGLIDPETAQKVGKMVGADALVTGTLTPFGESVRLSVKTVGTESAALLAASRAEIPRTGTIDELLRHGVGGGGSSPGAGRAEPVAVPGFTFDVQSCELRGGDVTCVVLVRSEGRDRTLRVTDGTRLFDDLGNEYSPRRISIANTAIEIPVGGPGWRRMAGYYAEKVLVGGVTTSIRLEFGEVSQRATNASLLSVGCADPTGSFSVEFRDVSLEVRSPSSLHR